MPTLPASTDFTGSGITEAEFKTAMTNMRGFLADLLGTAGTQAAAQVALQTLLGAGVTAKGGAYTIATSDRGRLFNCTGTWTLTLPAAATAGAGFTFALRNSGAGVITIDPNASEKIDGATTITVAAGASCLVVCTGTAWLTVGLAIPITYPISVANGGTGATGAAGARNNLAAVGRDHGHNNIGSFCFAAVTGTVAGVNSTRAGSGLIPCSGDILSYSPSQGGTLSGTWRCLGVSPAAKYVDANKYDCIGTLWQRIS